LINEEEEKKQRHLIL